MTTDYDKLNYASHDAFYWSRSASTDVDYARYFYLGDSVIWQARSNYRYRGDSLRCLYHHIK